MAAFLTKSLSRYWAGFTLTYKPDSRGAAGLVQGLSLIEALYDRNGRMDNKEISTINDVPEGHKGPPGL